METGHYRGEPVVTTQTGRVQPLDLRESPLNTSFKDRATTGAHAVTTATSPEKELKKEESTHPAPTDEAKKGSSRAFWGVMGAVWGCLAAAEIFIAVTTANPTAGFLGAFAVYRCINGISKAMKGD